MKILIKRKTNTSSEVEVSSYELGVAVSAMEEDAIMDFVSAIDRSIDDVDFTKKLLALAQRSMNSWEHEVPELALKRFSVRLGQKMFGSVLAKDKTNAWTIAVKKFNIGDRQDDLIIDEQLVQEISDEEANIRTATKDELEKLEIDFKPMLNRTIEKELVDASVDRKGLEWMEISRIVADLEKAMRQKSGETVLIPVSARQIATLLSSYLSVTRYAD